MQDILEWLKQWLLGRGRSAADTISPDEDLVVCGLIDSFGMIELIGAIESHYGIEFSQEDFQQRGFSTLRGLATTINRLRSTAKGHSYGD